MAVSSGPRRVRQRLSVRMALGCLAVLLAAAGTTTAVVLEQVHTFVRDISVDRPLQVSSKALARSHFGQPETFLLVGDDTRSVYKYYNAFVPNLANEMLLVRIDPSKPWISMLSLPRELWVNITEPDGATYTNRLNSAYTYGTTTLLQTIRQVTGLSVNHVIATTFTQFENAIDTLGCVYATIDERYFHNNALGGDQYQNVDLEPGYECLNGSQAEQFVSYRHTDTSQVRDARDQSFLLAVKAQYGPQLASHIGEFEKVFGRTVQTDAGLRSSSEILNLADLLISAEGLRVRQVPFQTTPCATTCPTADLTATPQQIRQSVDSFLYGSDAAPGRQAAALGRAVGARHGLQGLPLTPTAASDVAAERADGAALPFTAEFPRVQDVGGDAVPVATSCTELVQACLRDYLIRAPGGDAYPIYVEVFAASGLGQFYDVQGTSWADAPILADPAQSVRIGGRTLELFYSGDHLQTVAWRQYGAAYWVHNTLSDSIGNAELLAIAAQTAPVGAVHGVPRVTARSALRAASSVLVPPSTGPPTTNSAQSAGRVAGLLTLTLVPLALVGVIVQRRRLRPLRTELAATTARITLWERQLGVPCGGVGGGGGRRNGSGVLAGRRRGWVAAAGLAVVLVAAGGLVALDRGLRGRRPSSVPSASVAVLGAGTKGDAARRLVVTLVHRQVHVVAVGYAWAAAPRTLEVLYGPGEVGQARRLADLLTPYHPVLGRLDIATERSLGRAAALVVVVPRA